MSLKECATLLIVDVLMIRNTDIEQFIKYVTSVLQKLNEITLKI